MDGRTDRAARAFRVYHGGGRGPMLGGRHGMREWAA
jgi:hypothetical protein